MANVMTRGISSVVLAICTVGWGPCHANSGPVADSAKSQQQKETDPKAQSQPKGQMSALTGCVDEQEGQWVLVNDQTMAIIANLAADGFPSEAFAKHVGQKVTVRGTASSGGSPPLFKVRSIETIGETCASR
jgi:hypothetical protein